MHQVDMEVQAPQTVQHVQRQVAEDVLRRCSQADVKEVTFTYVLHRDPITIPAVVLKLVQPQPAVIIRQVIRNLFLRKARLCAGGLVFHETYWQWFLKQAHKPMPQTVFEEVEQRIQWALGQLDLAQVTPKQWHAVPQLSEGDRRILQAALADIAPERLEAINPGFPR